MAEDQFKGPEWCTSIGIVIRSSWNRLQAECEFKQGRYCHNPDGHSFTHAGETHYPLCKIALCPYIVKD